MQIQSIMNFKSLRSRSAVARRKNAADDNRPIKTSGEEMKKRFLILIAAAFLFAGNVKSETPPLKLVQTIKLPEEIKGRFDHFAVDLTGNRLFATPEDNHAVLVFELKTGELLHTIKGIGKPHAILYREDLHELYITDGDTGDLKIFDSQTYTLKSSVKLLEDADSIGYDPVTKYLYIDNGGGDVHETYSMLSVVDTTAGKKVADIKVDGETLEAMALESSSPKMYVNNKARNRVDVIDRGKREILASWPIIKGKTNVAMALDETNHRLFVACRSGDLIVFDTASGKELTSLPIAKGVDDLVFDKDSKRIYAAADGFVDVYQEESPDNYKLLAKVPSGPVGRTARLVPELKRYFVAVPQHDTTPSEILVYDVQ
jgi:DNA-binding beta-propeller fold protein YncE